MPRAGRSFEEGRIYHVYNRVSGGRMEFADEELAALFTRLLRQVMQRDKVTVFAWCLLGNHYHLAVRQGPVPLSRSMKAVQQGVARARNRRCDSFGPLWQGRFNAKEVEDDGDLMQVIAYVHLNPVKAGMAEEAGEYRWSGHREILGRRSDPMVSVDEVLLLYGQTRRQALRGYRSAMANMASEEWSAAVPGTLPWWRRGRPTEEDRIMRREDAFIDELGRSTARWRPRYTAREWLELACTHLGCDLDTLRSRGRAPEIVRLRDLIGLVGIERYGVKVTELATELGKSRDGVSRWYRRGATRRTEDRSFAALAEALDQAASEDP